MENVTLTAHAAFRTPEASMTLLRRAIDIVRDIVGTEAASQRSLSRGAGGIRMVMKSLAAVAGLL